VLRSSLTTIKIAPPYPQQIDIPRPGDFELGSVQSRAAARALLEHATADDEQNRLRGFVETIGRPAIVQAPTCLRYWTTPDQKTGKRPLIELIKLQGVHSPEILERWIRRVPIDGKTYSMPKRGDSGLRAGNEAKRSSVKLLRGLPK
jgi:hypothetical protein